MHLGPRAVLVILVVIFASVFVYSARDYLLPAAFDPGDRYRSDRLDYMGVIYANRSDMYDWRGGYSETIDCPWGRIHNGLDFFFYNNSPVIAAAPGYVEDVSWRENPNTTLNMYNIYVAIRFNATIVVRYTFEPFTHAVGDQDRQLSMLAVLEGEWVQKGDLIGHFLAVDETSGHVHFGVVKGNEWIDPKPFYGASDLVEMLAFAHTYQPTWDISYPAP
jgi:murein DD-endopeptidase MepM/ murein hydrolase activator NlpD